MQIIEEKINIVAYINFFPKKHKTIPIANKVMQKKIFFS
jgi:hypothetical protein